MKHLQGFGLKASSKKRDLKAEYAALQNFSDEEEEKQESARGKYHQA